MKILTKILLILMTALYALTLPALGEDVPQTMEIVFKEPADVIEALPVMMIPEEAGQEAQKETPPVMIIPEEAKQETHEAQEEAQPVIIVPKEDCEDQKKMEEGLPSVQEFMVTYLDWNNEELFRIHVWADHKVEEVEFMKPNREGHMFEYWFDIADECEAKYEFGHKITQDLNLKAYYTQLPPEEEQKETEAPVEMAENMQYEIVSFIETGIDGLEIMIISDFDDDEQEAFEERAVQMMEKEEVTRQVIIHSSAGNFVHENDTVILTGDLTGFDECNVALQWQVLDGGNWMNIDGANDTVYSFPATCESIYRAYRLSVVIEDVKG